MIRVQPMEAVGTASGGGKNMNMVRCKCGFAAISHVLVGP